MNSTADIIGLPESSLVGELAEAAGIPHIKAFRMLRKLTTLPQDQWDRILIWAIDERNRMANARRSL